MNANQSLFESAQKVIPGGVNSPVRAFKGVGGTPPFIARGEGSYIYDETGKQYIDYVGSWGPMILGHAHPVVLQAVRERMENGLSFGAPTAIEIEMAETICQLLPSIEQVRMVNSGTEACMSAIRLARGFTGRDKFMKFEGGYHGHADDLLVKAGSGLLTGGTPTSAGVPADFAKHTLTATYNDLDNVKKIFADNPGTIAAVIIEPVAGNMNCVPATKEFLQGLREICTENGTVLIFDEVMCGFRVGGLQCAQGYYGVKPDLTTLGKIIGGGMPVGAFGGRREIMQCLAPIGAVYQAGTLSGNPVAMAAGLANLKEISRPGFYDELEEKTQYLINGITEVAYQNKIAFSTNQIGSMFGFFFTDKKVTNFKDACGCDIERFKKFFHGMLIHGIYLAPSAYEAGFMSIAHSKDDLDKTIDVANKVFAVL